jgi:hypothetical protein
MDPSWPHCPYCARLQQARPDVVNADSRAGEASMDQRNERKPTQVRRDMSPSKERRTEFYPEHRPRPDPAPRLDDNRRIVGVLVSYTWNPGGQVFEVREGRTHIGSGSIADEPGTRVEVHCPQDASLSSDHAMILVRQGQCYIRDLSSTNGTSLNGTPLPPENAETLTSPAEIKAGETVFTFVRVDGAKATVQPRAEPEPPAARKPTDLR